MKKSKAVLLFLLVAWLSLHMGAAEAEQRSLRIGIYNNPPLVFLDNNRKPTGLIVDLLTTIGEREGWHLEYVYSSWAKCLVDLQGGRLDLLAPIGYSKDRAKVFDYNAETILTNWGVVYTTARTKISSLFDLQGKKIAVLSGDIFYGPFKQILARFNVQARFWEAEDYDTTFQLLKAGRVDAAVVNRFYGLTHEKQYQVLSTPVVFHPIEIRIASPQGKNTKVLSRIDRDLRDLRLREGAYYFGLQNKWLGLRTLHDKSFFQSYKFFYLVGGLVVLLVALALFFRYQIARKAKELQTSLHHLRNEKRRRKKALDALEETESRYRTLFDSVWNSLMVLDAEGHLLECNRATSELFDVSLKEILGKKLTDLCVSGQTDEALPSDKLEALLAAALQGHPQRVECSLQRSNGEAFSAAVRIDQILYGGNSALLASVRDITVEKKFTQWLSDEKDRLEAVLDGSPIATFLIDPGGRVVLWNRACEDLTKIPREKMLGKPIDLQPLYDGKERPVLAKLLLCHDTAAIIERYEKVGIRQLPNHPEGIEVLTRIRVGDKTHHLHAVATRIRHNNGSLLGIIQCARDITKEVHLQNQLVHAQKMEAVGRLAGGIAHDFNNILTIIFGNVDLLTMQYKSDRRLFEKLNDMKRVAERAADLTNQLLAFSRKQILEVQVIDLNEVIRKARKMLEPLIGEDVRLEIRLEDGLWPIKADPIRLEQVIINLAVNARDAMPHGGVLHIETHNEELELAMSLGSFTIPPGRYAVLSVTDTGEGINDKVMEKIFDPFFTTKDKGIGTGLGLSMVYGIVKQLNGYVGVCSTPGRGATFDIYWPRTSGQARSARTTRIEEEECQGGAETILVVEDDPSVREILVSALRQQGYKVLAAAHGNDALQQCRNYLGTIDLLLTDIIMPGMNGSDLAQQVQVLRPGIRVLYISGYTDDHLAARGIIESKIHFLAKPFSSKELGRRVREVLNG